MLIPRRTSAIEASPPDRAMEPVPWGGLQTGLWSERPGEMRAASLASKTTLKLLISVPSSSRLTLDRKRVGIGRIRLEVVAGVVNF